MVINYNRLIGREFADVTALIRAEERRILLGIPKRVECLEPKRTTVNDFIKVIAGVTIDASPEVRMGGALSCLISETGYDVPDYDPKISAYTRDIIGRKIAEKLGNKVRELATDPRRVLEN